MTDNRDDHGRPPRKFGGGKGPRRPFDGPRGPRKGGGFKPGEATLRRPPGWSPLGAARSHAGPPARP